MPETEVLIDRNRRRALVRSRRLGDAGLDAYRTLEQRIAVTEPEWTIELIPPMGVLPANIPFGEDGPNARGSEALAVIGWAAQRLDRAVVLSGDPDATEQAAERLREQGVRVELLAGFGPVRAQWAPEGE